MKNKMLVLALSSTALLILGPSSLTAFAQDLPPGKIIAFGHGRSRGQTIYIGGINTTTVTPPETVNVQYTLFNPNEDADILITDIRVVDPDGTEVDLPDNPLPFLELGPLPKTLPAMNSTIVLFNQLVNRDPTPPPTIRSQVLFTWVSASNSPILPLKIVGLEFRFRPLVPGPGTTQVGRNTTLPHLILERGP